MKKLLLIITSLVVLNFSGSYAQSTLLVTDVANGNTTITNGMVISRNVGAYALDQFDINIKNISSTNRTYKMRMYYDQRHVVAAGDSSSPYFCFGSLCYTPNVFTSTKTQSLTPNQDASGVGNPISVHYDEASSAGMSIIRYRIFEISNPSSDLMEFTVNYNNATAVKNNGSLLANVSEVYPSPSNTKAFVNVNAIAAHNNAGVTITNSLGSVVSVKTTDLLSGKNTISLDVDNLASGIYFTTITAGNSKIVKKFIINK
jgi:hypothetical protein